jgi:2',3'-cyclic-nucleotide 2'-phosphodiesterase (5'-nucleotidase family)
MLVRSPNRRQFLRLLAGATLATAAPRWLRAGQSLSPDVVAVSILHTTDLHGHILPTFDYAGNPDLGGLARCATQIAQWRRENPNSILIDVGDVYQGTQFGFGDEGRTMIDLFNFLRYDAWIVGNHEFDWGIDAFLHAVARSGMPVLAANTAFAGKAAGKFAERDHPFSRVQPFIWKQFSEIKLAIVGLTTPGMPFWFLPKFTAGIEFLDPLEPTRQAIRQARAEGANAIVLAGHMGLKERTGGDDFANRAVALTAEFPDVSAFIAGHTHQSIPSRLTNGTILTQADHFGIHAGRVDLLFDRGTKRLLQTEARTELMDDQIASDPALLSRVRPQLEAAHDLLSQPVGELAETLSAESMPGTPSPVGELIAIAIRQALSERSVSIEGVFHGLFNEHAWHQGSKTIADIWTILPYENFLVTAELDAVALRVMLEDTFASRESRSLAGFRFDLSGERTNRRVINLRLADGQRLDPARLYRIAMNTFDASSAGHRFMKLRQILERPEAKLTFHPVQTRDALITYFRERKTVRKEAFLPSLPKAA